jgi:hypothetical protein
MAEGLRFELTIPIPETPSTCHQRAQQNAFRRRMFVRNLDRFVPENQRLRRLQGSTKDLHKAAVIKKAAKAGIRKRTVERASAKPKKTEKGKAACG